MKILTSYYDYVVGGCDEYEEYCDYEVDSLELGLVLKKKKNLGELETASDCCEDAVDLLPMDE